MNKIYKPSQQEIEQLVKNFMGYTEVSYETAEHYMTNAMYDITIALTKFKKDKEKLKQIEENRKNTIQQSTQQNNTYQQNINNSQVESEQIIQITFDSIVNKQVQNQSPQQSNTKKLDQSLQFQNELNNSNQPNTQQQFVPSVNQSFQQQQQQLNQQLKPQFNSQQQQYPPTQQFTQQIMQLSFAVSNAERALQFIEQSLGTSIYNLLSQAPTIQQLNEVQQLLQLQIRGEYFDLVQNALIQFQQQNQQNTQVHEQIKVLNQKSSHLESQLKQRESAFNQLQQQLVQLQTENNSLKQQNLQDSEYKNQITNLEHEIKKLIEENALISQKVLTEQLPVLQVPKTATQHQFGQQNQQIVPHQVRITMDMCYHLAEIDNVIQFFYMRGQPKNVFVQGTVVVVIVDGSQILQTQQLANQIKQQLPQVIIGTDKIQ
ncbi:Hypothetical_protein [Hexamita inflata]|uniref:Hypothetical_protein n=1 Tax=Hexamita inflata TaxID=28002 RepID=A0AA86NDU6_9EUKA|nr:Hypothetical protein HINF_LOCUS4909 [Hexamita inflata]